MASGDKCRECGTAIPADSPEGFCAQCLLGLGLEPTGESVQSPKPKIQGQEPELSRGLTEKSGDRIGRYRLLEKIGHGGCGVVYLAEQEEPVRRKVALKVIKLGMDTRQVVARFDAERQALALMDHPNIAKVLDAGATESGRPYFVMELVRGIRITDYCDQNELSTAERLKLFIQVCQAIQHAHQKGIIHRDIKPSNILVTLHDGVPVPKVIDFGIAKATQGRLTNQTLFTAFEQFIGTPAYMSPEQAELSALDIDTRSDIYSLGVLLYELLTGKTPVDARELMEQGIDAMRRAIREEEPLRPSTKLATLQGEERSTTAKRRAMEMPRLIHLVRGDLDWIVMKCLEKDRTRRYETSNGLATDLKRHLENEPVAARPPSAAYRLQKAVRRNKVAFTAAAAVAVVLVGGAVVSSRQALIATRARKAEAVALRHAQTNAQNATARLYESLVGQARATRVARKVGFREEAFNLLGKANALETSARNLSELRQEAVACMGDFMGLRPQTIFTDPNGRLNGMKISPNGHYVVLWDDTTVRLCELPSGRELHHWDPPLPIREIAIQRESDRVYALCFPSGDSDDTSVLRRIAQSQIAEFARDESGEWTQVGWHSRPGTASLSAGRKHVFCITDAPGEQAAQKTIQVVRADTGEVVNSISRSDGSFVLFTALMDPRERLFVAAANSKDGKRLFEVWDLATHSRRNTLNIDLHHVTGISFSSDGAFFVLGSWEGSQVYETEEFGLIDQFSGYVSGQSRASFSSKGLLPVPLNQQNRLAIRDFRKHERLAVLEEDDDIFSGSFTPDGQSLLTASSRRISRYAFAGAQECLDLTGHRMSVPGIAFSRDGRRLASVSIDQTMRVWDANTGKLISQSNQLLLAEGQTICFSPDGRVVCTGDYDSPTIQFWDVESGKKLMEVKDTLESGTWSLLWLPDPKIGSRLIRGSRGSGPDSVVSMWKLASSDALLASRPGACELLNSIPQEGMVCGLVVSPDQKRMVYRVNDTDKPGKLLSAEVSAPQQRNELPYEPRFMMQGVAFTSDSGHLAMVTKENTVIIVDLEAERVVRTFDCGHSFSDKLVISSDGRWLALESGSFLGVDIYDFNAGKLLYSLPDREGTVYWIAWQPGSARLAVARDNGAIEIWDMNRIDNQLEQLGLGLESKSSTTKQTPSKPKTRPANKPVSIGPDEADH